MHFSQAQYFASVVWWIISQKLKKGFIITFSEVLSYICNLCNSMNMICLAFSWRYRCSCLIIWSMDFYLESASALIMLTGIFLRVDVCLHYYVLVEISKCKHLKLSFPVCSIWYNNSEVLVILRLAWRKMMRCQKNISTNTYCSEAKSIRISATNSRSLTEAFCPCTLRFCILSSMEMFQCENIRGLEVRKGEKCFKLLFKFVSNFRI